MINRFALVVAFVVVLFGCQSTQTPVFNAAVIDIETEDLDRYWIAVPTPIKYHNGRPKFIPPGRGQGVYSITIDSTGTVTDKVLVSSIPDGWLTQKHVDLMPTKKYEAAAQNSTRQPVRVEVSFAIMPRTEIDASDE